MLLLNLITETVVAAPDPFLEAVKSSGPAGGLVVLLGVLIKSWLGNISGAIGRLEASTSVQSKDIARTEVRVEDLARRVESIERKAS